MTTQMYNTLPDGKTELNVTKAIINYGGFQESILLMIDHMNKQELPYDGLAGFSQGYFIV